MASGDGNLKKEVKVRVFSDQSVDLNMIWFVVVILLVALSAFLGYRVLSQDCPDVSCPNCPTCPECQCPPCQLDCDKCPAKEVQIAKEIIKYRCMGRDLIVDDPDDCAPAIDQEDLLPSDDDGTFIKDISVSPSCVSNADGGAIYFQAGAIADAISVQVKEPNGEYRTVLSFEGLFDGHKEFAICEPEDAYCKRNKGDFNLERYKRYIMRLEFDFREKHNTVVHSAEMIVDTTTTSRYSVNECGTG